jgi:quercetin dioxygenase-like cupin family protein
VSPSASGGAFSIIETINAPGKGPPRHKHPHGEIFRVLEGRYLYEMDGRRFYAETGDVISIPGGAEHGFVNVTDKPARHYIVIAPALDAAAFFTELADVVRNGAPDKAALDRFGRQVAGRISRGPANPCRSANRVKPCRAQALIRPSTSEIDDRSAVGAVAAT